MKTNKFKLMRLLMCVAAAFSFVSCEKELTNESVVGKKMYTNNLPNAYVWVQSEISFAANNTAYLTKIYTDYEDGDVFRTSPYKATYNVVYPDVIFEDEDGDIYSATFVDNKTLVFNISNYDISTIDEEEMAMVEETPCFWREVEGWSFHEKPKDITGPYAGQYFEFFGDVAGYGASQSIRMSLGVNYAYVRWDSYSDSYSRNAVGRLVVNYPTIAIGDSFEGQFLDANRIQLTEWEGEDLSGYNIILDKRRL